MGHTAALVDYILGSRLETIPPEIRHEGKRALVNIVGCTLGGADHEAVEIAIAALGPIRGPPDIGRDRPAGAS